MAISDQLKLLAKGLNPDTGEVLEDSLLINRPEVIRILFELSEELVESNKTNSKKPKLSQEQRRQKNISEGRPARANFQWLKEDKENLSAEFKKNPSIKHLATFFERSELSIAVQLHGLKLIPDETLESYRKKSFI